MVRGHVSPLGSPCFRVYYINCVSHHVGALLTSVRS